MPDNPLISARMFRPGSMAAAASGIFYNAFIRGEDRKTLKFVKTGPLDDIIHALDFERPIWSRIVLETRHGNHASCTTPEASTRTSSTWFRKHW